MYQALLVMFMLVAVGLVALIMLQQSKGVDMGASFGAGSSSTLFGSSGSGNFMTRMTAVLATMFFVLSLVLGNLSSNHGQKGRQWDNLNQAQQADRAQDEAPAKPGNDIPQ
ncbi:preprotein translocase subunit SecG [Sodalis-like symbiont of Bactericera trigonica]|nr:preprotein translocase subunit SecG [Sodalis-like symbiont of Bactericera trigonica]